MQSQHSLSDSLDFKMNMSVHSLWATLLSKYTTLLAWSFLLVL